MMLAMFLSLGYRIMVFNNRHYAPHFYALLLRISAYLVVLAAFVMFAEFWNDANVYGRVSSLAFLVLVRRLIWGRSSVVSSEAA